MGLERYYLYFKRAFIYHSELESTSKIPHIFSSCFAYPPTVQIGRTTTGLTSPTIYTTFSNISSFYTILFRRSRVPH